MTLRGLLQKHFYKTFVKISVLRPKKVCVSGFLTYPIFSSDPKDFIGIPKKNEILSHATYPNCGHLLLDLPLSLSYFSSVHLNWSSVITHQQCDMYMYRLRGPIYSKLVTGPNRPHFIIYFGQMKTYVVFLFKIRENNEYNFRKNKVLKATFLP